MTNLPRLFTSHWRNRELAELDTTIIGISRGTPRRSPGFRYKLLRSLAPDNQVWAQEDREAFEAAYLDQLDALAAETILADLKRIAGDHPAVLLCWEMLAEPDEWCHRRMLAGWLEKQTGIVVPELEAGTLTRKPDAQPALFDYREGRE